MNISRKSTNILRKTARIIILLVLAIIITGVCVTPSLAWDKKHYKHGWNHKWKHGHGHYYATPVYGAPAVLYGPPPVYLASPPPPPPPGISVVLPLHIH